MTKVDLTPENKRFLLDEAADKNMTVSEIVDRALTQYQKSVKSNIFCSICGEPVENNEGIIFEGRKFYHVGCYNASN